MKYVLILMLLACSKPKKEPVCYKCTVNCWVGHPDYDTVICNPSFNPADPVNDGHGNMCSPKKCVIQ